MDSNIQKNGLINLIVLLVVTGSSLFVAKLANCITGEAGILFAGFGVLIAGFSYFQMRLEASERLEKLEFEELAKSRKESTLFESAAEDALPARHAREQFEKWMVPAFTIVLLVLQSVAAWLMWKRILKTEPDAPSQSMIAMALYGLFAVTLFLLGKYAAGLARLDGQRLLRPAASYMLLNAYLCFISTAAIAADQFGYTKVDLNVARALCVILTLAALETLLGLVLEIYRPRTRGQAPRLLYESRLIGLLAQPEGLFTTAAHALDYQFGFKVSDTWFYRMMEKELPLLIIIQVAVLWLWTSFIIIEPSEKALLERFGKGQAVLGPGWHLKLPWPIDAIHRYRTEQIQGLHIGYVPDPDKENEKTVLWTVAHNKEEFNLLVASREPQSQSSSTAGDQKVVPANLLTVSIPLQYKIKDLEKWALKHSEPAALLEKLATREVVRHLVGVDLAEIMSTGRERAAAELQKAIQARADEFGLGADILFVGLQDIHPPTAVAEAYQAVVSALQEKEAKIHNAEGYSSMTNALAQGNAYRIVREAEAYQMTRTASAAARAAQFVNQITAFEAAPTVYPSRVYHQTFAASANGPRKFIIMATNTHDIIQLNLEDKLRKDLLDVEIKPVKK
jgi:membrane protease subunit HflK